ncbi:hypothetical protein BN159_6050 [Streptomyces davaonensis JCM 4913]|uniref:Thioesterase TesA-like domain-containing protein n=1 Tax=Streptomyces davaonensis (strain DSM 101723 / JCM 4913 / KCC S-0913 / 768) TaxID=1214101 RepID=K4RC67_STRDJ|nr:alpha/beta fold hydrolase [Streptomyces davaonensis]CCK30429.1 hypothetical protein BN159_6050 [Streptomyces davaonensis JCM 4913]
MSTHSVSPRADWIGARFAVGRPRLRLLCLPQAGGSAATFGAWRPHLPDGAEVAAVELPGRGARMGEPMPSAWGPLIEAVLDGIRAELAVPYALFGHSFGGTLAYELTLRIEREGLRPPSALVCSAARAPHLPLGREAVAGATDEELADWLRSGDGLPSELLAFPDFLREVLRAVRADLALAESHRIPQPVPVSCPLLTLAGEQDEVATVAQVEPWAAYASGAYRMQVLPGGHAFPRTHPRQTMSAVFEGLTGVGAFPGEGDGQG